MRRLRVLVRLVSGWIAGDTTGGFSPTFPSSVVTHPQVVNLRMQPTRTGFSASAEHERLDAYCFVHVDTTAGQDARQRDWPRCEVTGIREEDLVPPVLLIGGALILGWWAGRRSGRMPSAAPSIDGSPRNMT